MRVIIAGGGLVGLTAAAAFRREGLDVVVIEQAADIRAAGAGIGLWRNALDVLDEVGVGRELVGLGTTVDTWFLDAAGQRLRASGFDAADHTFTLVPRAALNELLADAVDRTRIRHGARVTDYTEDEDAVIAHLSDGSSVSADLLVGADGVHSAVRTQLLPGSQAAEHAGHHAWRALVPAGNERATGTVLTVGHARTRGGYSRIAGDKTMWMVNQFDSQPLAGSKKEQALQRAHHLNDGGWHDDLIDMIQATPEDAILHNQILLVPPLPRWASRRVALIGDAAHGLSPHISAGGTLGIEDVGVLRDALISTTDLSTALATYEAARLPHFQTVRELSAAVERAADAAEFARAYAAFSHWMLNPPTEGANHLRAGGSLVQAG